MLLTIILDVVTSLTSITFVRMDDAVKDDTCIELTIPVDAFINRNPIFGVRIDDAYNDDNIILLVLTVLTCIV